MNLPLKHSKDGFDDTFIEGAMYSPRTVSNRNDTIFPFLSLREENWANPFLKYYVASLPKVEFTLLVEVLPWWIKLYGINLVDYLCFWYTYIIENDGWNIDCCNDSMGIVIVDI